MHWRQKLLLLLRNAVTLVSHDIYGILQCMDDGMMQGQRGAKKVTSVKNVCLFRFVSSCFLFPRCLIAIYIHM